MKKSELKKLSEFRLYIHHLSIFSAMGTSATRMLLEFSAIGTHYRNSNAAVLSTANIFKSISAVLSHLQIRSAVHPLLVFSSLITIVVVSTSATQL